MNSFVFTCGDTNGIGPEIALKALNQLSHNGRNKFILPIPLNVFQYYSKLIKIDFEFEIVNTSRKINYNNESVAILDLGKVKLELGKPTRFSGRASYRSIIEAHKFVFKNLSQAMITTPISKLAWQKAGIKFPGHTELLADLSGSKSFSMMFLSSRFKCALATIHEPLSRVPNLITEKKLFALIQLVSMTLKNDLNIANPKIGILGLNPHSGEGGNIGKEEITKIIPAIQRGISSNINIDGPHVPDAFFANKKYHNYDAIIGMYHDQLLIPFKMLHFRKGVNYTAGLNFVRTSPDHGTAFDIAGQLKSDISSTIESYRWAKKIAKNRFTDAFRSL